MRHASECEPRVLDVCFPLPSGSTPSLLYFVFWFRCRHHLCRLDRTPTRHLIIRHPTTHPNPPIPNPHPNDSVTHPSCDVAAQGQGTGLWLRSARRAAVDALHSAGRHRLSGAGRVCRVRLGLDAADGGRLRRRCAQRRTQEEICEEPWGCVGAAEECTDDGVRRCWRSGWRFSGYHSSPIWLGNRL